MLRELSGVRQDKGGRLRRWFQSRDEDLIVWCDKDGSMYGFQLCYDRRRHERALTWTRNHGFSHNRVDAGEGRSFRHKGSPLLVADGRFDATAMSRRFLEISTDVPREITEFVCAKLAEYANGIYRANEADDGTYQFAERLVTLPDHPDSKVLSEQPDASSGTYRLYSRTELLAGGIHYLVFGIAFMLTPAGLWINDPEAYSWLAKLGFLALMLWGFGGCYIARTLLQAVACVQIDFNGTITLQRAIGITRISAFDVLRIEADVAKIWIPDANPRQVWIIHVRGKVLLPPSKISEKVIAELTRHNPNIKIISTGGALYGTATCEEGEEQR